MLNSDAKGEEMKTITWKSFSNQRVLGLLGRNTRRKGERLIMAPTIR